MKSRDALGVPAVVFLIAFAYRFLAFSGFDNDHFVHLSRALQIQLGELPVRDFVDPGMPLMYLVSAAAQRALGEGPLTEAILTIGLLAAGSALTCYLAARLSGSWPVALVATSVQVLLWPRLYGYPKIFVYAVGFVLLWRYSEAATTGRLALAAAWTALAFLFRHDHGVYLALAGMSAIVIRAAPDRGLMLARCALYFALTLAALVPYLDFLHRHGGIVRHIESAVAFSREEARHTRLAAWPGLRGGFSAPFVQIGEAPRSETSVVHIHWAPGLTEPERVRLERRHHLEVARDMGDGLWAYELKDISWRNVRALIRDPRVIDTDGIVRALGVVVPSQALLRTEFLRRVPLLRVESPLLARWLSVDNAIAWMYYGLLLVPFSAIVVLIVTRRAAAGECGRHGVIVTLALVLAAMNAWLLRDLLTARLPDVSVPAVVLGAWLIAQVPGRAIARVTVAAIVGSTLTASAIVGDAGDRIKRTGLIFGPSAMLSRAVQVTRDFGEWPWAKQWPRGALPPLVKYIHECTRPTDRLMVTWFAPEYFFFSRRGFAGGHVTFLPGYYTSVDDQRATLTRLAAQSVPIALTDSRRYDSSFATEFPILRRHLDLNYHFVGEHAESDAPRVGVLVDRRRAPTGTWGPRAWPCFR